MHSMRRFIAVFVFFPFSLSFSMDQHIPHKVLSLKELAARQVAVSYPENHSQIVALDVPQDCKTAVARQLLLAKQYQEVMPMGLGNDPIYLLRELQLSEETYYKGIPYQKPTKHPENPFIGDKLLQKKFRFPHEYTKTNIQNVVQYFADNEKNNKFFMRGFQDDSDNRLCAGPNKNAMLMYADNHAAYICELRRGQDRITVWNRISHKIPKTKEEDRITALEVCTYENAFWSGTQSGRLYVYEHILVEPLFDRYQWLARDLNIPTQDPIDDIHLSSCGEFLWILARNKLLSCKRVTAECKLVFEIRDLPSFALGDDERESMNVFVISPDSKYALMGGTRGTILVADLATNKSYLLEEESGSGIYQLWWTNKDVERPVVALKNDGMLIALKLAIAKAEQFFDGVE
jgi:hypothetical protein